MSNTASKIRKAYLCLKRKLYGLPKKDYKGYMSERKWEEEAYKIGCFSDALIDPDSCLWFLDL